ncbi:DUF4169 family protein [Mesorhizobium sp. CGMCC 1.15528]|uniref:DUF4169 family protein n=1 Tax=Mesorhizobium zhangyense TaxID=1776730 RepID=A0A7C9R8P3_9HYPH|nr:DUF4169 family protein [Mesorhizobium zhangyense]NGN40953.1 DUF4169 family protein [Mesorhizobium zhangyense]
MAEIVNLRQARKHKARADKERAAEQNRVLHGRTKSEKTEAKQSSEKAVRFIDGHKRERPDGNSGK